MTMCPKGKPPLARSGSSMMMKRGKPALTEGEAMFLKALLIDEPTNGKTLNDEMLFSLPFESPSPQRRSSGQLLGLWKAHEDGVKPKALVRHASLQRAKSASKKPPRHVRKKSEEEIQALLRMWQGDQEGVKIGDFVKRQASYEAHKEEAKKEIKDDDESFKSVRSDVEVRVEHDASQHGDFHSSCSSWKEEEGGQEHYDAWEVLKDEYAEDFGFDYSYSRHSILEVLNDEDQGHTFKILGTSADDVLSQPHVLSPPLMDALMSFLPETLEYENWWMRYSLVRDGSSMETLKHYVRASRQTVLAIETTTGEVFGAFTTSPWRTQFGFFGTGEGAFLWKMRYNRNSTCHSLFEQAHLESEIDVFAYSGLNRLVQHCSHDRIGIGGGDLSKIEQQEGEEPADLLAETGTYSFGIALDESLARGTTGPCATFRNPCLLDNSSQLRSFEIANMEVWTLTPSWDVNSAQKLEMQQYFAEQSTHSQSSSVHSIYSEGAGISPPPTPGGRQTLQERFYRRVGENDEREVDRDRWAYAQMMMKG